MQALRALLLLPLLGSCRSAPSELPPQSPPADRLPFVYRARVDGVPSDARRVRLTVRLPAEDARGALLDLRGTCLVGNASFELPLAVASTPALPAGASCVIFESTPGHGRTLVLETDGRAPEFKLLFELVLPAGSGPQAAAELERALAPAASAEVDGRAWAQLSCELRRRVLR
jgi:hypothetical protein